MVASEKDKTVIVKNKAKFDKSDLILYLFFLPGMLTIIIFAYVPMLGMVGAFQKFDVVNGFFKSEFVGLKHFKYLFFENPIFWRALKNTFKISSLKLLFGFTLPILLSLLINEVRNLKFKKVVQTMFYVPNFVSWVVVAGIWYALFALKGPVNEILINIGFLKESFSFMDSTKAFYPIIIFTDLWKGLGYNTIFYMAALSNISQDQYEAAMLDGAGRLKQAIYITLPSIIPTIVLLFILSTGGLLNAGFDQMWTMQNPATQEMAEILDTAVLRTLQSSSPNAISVGIALGLFKSIFGIVLFFLANKMAKKFTGSSIV